MSIMNFYTAILSILILVILTTITPTLATVQYQKKFGYRPNVELCFKNITTQLQATSDQQTNNTPYPRCITLNSPFCLDFNLPYKATILPEHIPDLTFGDVEEVRNYLQRWQVYKGFPKCWSYLKRTLCSILMPECVEDTLTGRAIRQSKPSVDMCYDLVKNCKFLARHFEMPLIFNCSDNNLFARNCTNELRDPSLSQTQAVCQFPLVPSNDSNSWFKDIDGCSISCKHPISNQSEQDEISSLIRVLCTIGLLTTSVAIILFETAERYEGRKKKTSYLAKVIKRCIICQLILYIGWSLQVFFNNNIACGPNGSTLTGLTLFANACVLSFLLTYLPSLSILFWSAYLGRLCHAKLIGKSENQSELNDSSRVDLILNFMSFGIPSILFITVALLSQIDGHGLYGICTVGQQSVIIKTLFVFTPKVIGAFYGNFYFLMTIFKLMKVEQMKPSLRRNFIRITILAILNFMDVIFSIWNYFYNYLNQQRWIQSIDSYLACNSNLKSIHDESYVIGRQEYCTIDKPMITLYLLEVFSTLSIGIVIASWAFCETNLKAIRLMFIDLLEDDEAKKLKLRANMNKDPDTFHDPIDYTSPTRTNNRELELDTIINQQEHSNSLANSIDISVGSNFSRTSKRHQPYQLHNPNHLGLTARDVINDQRSIEEQRRLAEAGQLPNGQLMLPPELIEIFLSKFFGSMPQCPVSNLNSDAEPPFNHGMGQSMVHN